MSLILWCFFSLLMIYLYAGFPLILGLLARLFKRCHKIDETYEPTVTLVISAYNEENVIQEKLENSLQLDYPAEKLKILVVSDCSSDRTDEIVDNFCSRYPQIKLVQMTERTGKTLGLNKAIEQITSDMVVFSDANAIYNPQAVRKLVRHFADASVGYVVGHARYAVDSGSSAEESEGLYWNYEIKIKQWESDFYSVVGGDGALYMIRRELYFPLEETDINDFVNPLQIVAAGYRGIFDAEAFCTEQASDNFEKEFGRKVRIVNRSFNGLLRVAELLNPFKFGRFTWLVASHKLLRWFSPFVLLAHFITTLTLSLHHPYPLVTIISLIFYIYLGFSALVGWLAEQKGTQAPAPFYLAYYYLLMNIASAYGIIKRLSGNRIVTWSTVRSDGTGRDVGRDIVLAFIATFLVIPTLKLSFVWIDISAAVMFEIVICTLFTLLLHAYIGYPLVLLILKPLLKQKHQLDEKYQPTVTLLIAAYNEEAVIAEKLQNSLELDYPQHKIEILVVSDGSSDRTEAIAQEFVSQGIALLALTPNRGKITALNTAFKQIDTDIVILSDANVMYQPSVIRKLVRHFVDPDIGAVSGKVVLLNDDISYSSAEDQYYNIEHMVQRLEGETGSLIGSDGAMYALRRELYPWPASDTILDDFVISMSVVHRGKRLIHDPEALGFERNDQELNFEFRRKVRIVAGGIQCLLRSNVLPPPQQLFTWFKFISHKVLRWLSGPILLLLSIIVLVYFILFPGEQSLIVDSIAVWLVIFFSLGFVGLVITPLNKNKLFVIVNYMILMHLASVVGVWRGLTKGQSVTWKRPT